MEIERLKWANEEAQSDIQSIWEQLGKAIVNMIMEKLLEKREDFPLLEEGISFMPDWSSPDDWLVQTLSEKTYNSGGSYTKKEKLLLLSGRLFILRFNTIQLEPSFKFILDKTKRTLVMEIGLIKKMMEEIELMKDNSAIKAFGEDMFNETLQIGEEREIPSGLERDLRSAFKSLGFTKDEMNLMVHNVVRHESFTESMDLGEMVRIGLDMKETF